MRNGRVIEKGIIIEYGEGEGGLSKRQNEDIDITYLLYIVKY